MENETVYSHLRARTSCRVKGGKDMLKQAVYANTMIYRVKGKNNVTTDCKFHCCGSNPFFPDPDPVLKIRIRVTQKDQVRPDPDLMFFMLSKINIFFIAFFTKSKHLTTLKIKGN